MTTDPTTPSLPSAPANLIKKFAPGWTHHVSGPCTGTLVVGGLSEETDGAGKRSRITREVSVTSYTLKACHAGTRRALVAVWVHQHGDETAKGTPRWALDMAYRGRHDGEHTPQALDARQLAAYAGSRTVAVYLASLDGLAARRAAKQATTTELSDSVPTEEAA